MSDLIHVLLELWYPIIGVLLLRPFIKITYKSMCAWDKRDSPHFYRPDDGANKVIGVGMGIVGALCWPATMVIMALIPWRTLREGG